MVDNKLFIDKLKQISVNKLNIEKNFNQNNIVFNLYKCYQYFLMLNGGLGNELKIHDVNYGKNIYSDFVVVFQRF